MNGNQRGFSLAGKLYKISDTEQIKPTFQKREFVVEYGDNPQYPQYLKFEAIQDKCGIVDNFSEGDQVQVDFDLRGREWVSPQGDVKYFNTLSAWRVRPLNTSSGQPASSGQADDIPPPPPLEEGDLGDDLPF